MWLFPLKISSCRVQTEQKKQDLTLHNYSPVCNNKDIVERMKSAQQRQQTHHKCCDLHLTVITLMLSELQILPCLYIDLCSALLVTVGEGLAAEWHCLLANRLRLQGRRREGFSTIVTHIRHPQLSEHMCTFPLIYAVDTSKQMHKNNIWQQQQTAALMYAHAWRVKMNIWTAVATIAVL